MQLYRIALIGMTAVTLSISGCRGPQQAKPLGLEAVQRYFAHTALGTPVKKIEFDLGLPAPVETEAPAREWPHWKYRYLTDELMIYFHAEATDAKCTDFVYAGSLSVSTKKYYYDTIRRFRAGDTEP